MNVVELLRDDFGCDEDTIREVAHWVAVMSDKEKEIFGKRLEGKSMRQIGRELGITHFTVSGIINSWDHLRESLEDATIEP